MFNNLINYINDKEFRLIYLKNNLYIVNYIKILVLEENMSIIKCNDFNILIKGANLILSKLFDNELLISGKINSIEVKYE